MANAAVRDAGGRTDTDCAMRNCPTCGEPVDGKRCLSCNPDTRRGESSFDPMYGCCEYVSYGDRCHYPGSISSSQRGGPFRCQAHDRESDDGDAIVKQSHHDVPHLDYGLEARKRMADAYHAVRMAAYDRAAEQEAVSKRLPPTLAQVVRHLVRERQPGEDDV